LGTLVKNIKKEVIAMIDSSVFSWQDMMKEEFMIC
jgi:hypothetical protein